MDVSGIANLAIRLDQTETSQAVGISVLKKALDMERTTAAALLNAIPATPSRNLPPHLGQNIDTTA